MTTSAARVIQFVAGAFVASALFAAPAAAQQLAFPEAEGFGRFAAGARTNLASASIYHVTNLNDSGAGSLRDALSQSNRFVVFNVGGIANITSVITVASNITIAGQTAPGGFQVFGNRVAFHGANNLISRHWAIRKGASGGQEDAVSVARGSNMIWDHMSVTWGVDGTFDMNPDDGQIIDNITIQNSVIGQGLNVSNHSTGGLMTLGPGRKFSVIKSLFADNKTRNPKAFGDNEFINNVVYGFTEDGYIMGDTTGTSNANIEGNYFIRGPQGSGGAFTRGTPTFHMYANDNWLDGDRDGVLDGSLITSYGSSDVVGTRHAFPTIPSMTAQQAVAYVMSNVGPHITRDSVDTRLAQEVASYGTLGGVLNRETDLYTNYATNPAYLKPRARLSDTDNDAIPDNWETANGLNPLNNADWKGLSGGYTRLEQYLNELGSNGTTKTSIGGAWTDAANWGGAVPTLADVAIASAGVDHAAGNAFARRLSLAGASTVSGGTLDVFDTMTIGPASSGSLAVTGGVVSAGQIIVAPSGSSGSLALEGGTIRTGTISTGGGAASFAWNGGTIRATGAPRIAIPVALGPAGGTIDTNGFDGEVLSAISGPGGLTKSGAGRLRLASANSIGGPIAINAGAIAISNANSLGGAPQVTIASGAALDATGAAASTVTAVSGQTITGSGSVLGNLVAAAGSIIRPQGALVVQGKTVAVQAEAMTRGSDWALFDAATHGTGNGGTYGGAGLNGGGVVLVAGESLTVPTANGGLSTTVNIPTPGAWKLFARLVEPATSGVAGDPSTGAGGNNSIYVSNNPAMLGATLAAPLTVQTITNATNSASSHWTVMSAATTPLSGVVGPPNPAGIDYNLAAGPQTFSIYGREVGTILDAFVLSPTNLTGAELDAALVAAVGNFTQQANSTLQIDIGAAPLANTLAVGGAATLAGTLAVDLAPGFAPLPSDAFTILTAASITGTFAGVPHGARILTDAGGSFQVDYAANNVKLTNFLAPIAADFDRNGVVDNADLGVWNTAMIGSTTAGDANGDGQTDGSDFLVWQRQLGSTVLGVAVAAAVPEPAGLTLLWGTAVGAIVVRRRLRR